MRGGKGELKGGAGRASNKGKGQGKAQGTHRHVPGQAMPAGLCYSWPASGVGAAAARRSACDTDPVWECLHGRPDTATAGWVAYAPPVQDRLSAAFAEDSAGSCLFDVVLPPTDVHAAKTVSYSIDFAGLPLQQRNTTTGTVCCAPPARLAPLLVPLSAALRAALPGAITPNLTQHSHRQSA